MKRQETQAEKHKAELWSRATILQLEEIQVAIKRSGSSRKCISDCQIFEQFEKEDGEEDIHFSVAMIMLSMEKSTEVLKEAIYSIEERQRILDLNKTHAL